MTHGTQFAVLPELTAAWNDPGGNVAFKVRLQGEAFALAGTCPASGGDDFAAMKAAFLSESEACFVIFSTGGSWTLISFVPDEAPVRDRMLYSSSRANLMRALGGAEAVSNEAHGPCKHDTC